VTIDVTPCDLCGGPYHESTGGRHWVEWSGRWSLWCGTCEGDFVRWFVNHARGRHRKLKIDGKTVIIKFYDCVGQPKTEDQT
jgi:hypothetical protein